MGGLLRGLWWGSGSGAEGGAPGGLGSSGSDREALLEDMVPMKLLASEVKRAREARESEVKVEGSDMATVVGCCLSVC